MDKVKSNLLLADRLIIASLFVIMAVFSIVSTIAATNHNHQTEQLKELLTVNRVYSEANTVCILRTSGAVNTGEIPYTSEAIREYVSKCFTEETNIANNEEPTVTTTTIENKE